MPTIGMRDKGRNVDAWDQMESWELVLPPSRPSRQHLDWFRGQVSELPSDVPIAILGSTPELRDMLASLGFCNVYVLERNLTFLERMNRLRVNAIPGTETVLAGDWMETLPGCDGNFFVVLSDLTSGNVPYKQQGEFYTLVADSLQTGGMFCDKLLSYPIPHERLNVLLDKYENAPLNLDTVNRFNCEVFFCSELLTLFGRVDTDRFYEYLSRMQIGPMVRAILDRLPKVTPPGMTWDYGKPWNVIQTVFDSRLQCSDDRLERGDSPYANRLRCLRWDKQI